MSRPPVDLARLKRVIELGCADAARDSGLLDFALSVTVVRAADRPILEVVLVELTPEQAAELREAQAAEQGRRDAGN